MASKIWNKIFGKKPDIYEKYSESYDGKTDKEEIDNNWWLVNKSKAEEISKEYPSESKYYAEYIAENIDTAVTYSRYSVENAWVAVPDTAVTYSYRYPVCGAGLYSGNVIYGIPGTAGYGPSGTAGTSGSRWTYGIPGTAGYGPTGGPSGIAGPFLRTRPTEIVNSDLDPYGEEEWEN